MKSVSTIMVMAMALASLTASADVPRLECQGTKSNITYTTVFDQRTDGQRGYQATVQKVSVRTGESEGEYTFKPVSEMTGGMNYSGPGYIVRLQPGPNNNLKGLLTFDDPAVSGTTSLRVTCCQHFSQEDERCF